MGNDKDSLDVGVRNPPEKDPSGFLGGSSDNDDKEEKEDQSESRSTDTSETDDQQENTATTSSSTDESVQCTFYLNGDVKRRLEQYCDEQGRTQSWTVEHAVEAFLEDEGY